jgi:hypothetical protein
MIHRAITGPIRGRASSSVWDAVLTVSAAGCSATPSNPVDQQRTAGRGNLGPLAMMSGCTLVVMVAGRLAVVSSRVRVVMRAPEITDNTAICLASGARGLIAVIAVISGALTEDLAVSGSFSRSVAIVRRCGRRRTVSHDGDHSSAQAGDSAGDASARAQTRCLNQSRRA